MERPALIKRQSDISAAAKSLPASFRGENKLELFTFCKEHFLTNSCSKENVTVIQ